MQRLETEERTQKTMQKNEKSQLRNKPAEHNKEQETLANIGNTLERTTFHSKTSTKTEKTRILS